MTRRMFLLWTSLSPVALAAIVEGADLPPISWTCPMHPDVIQEKKGKCPICAMNLVPVRLDYVWSCPVHSVVEEDHAGKCPICRRDLVQVTVALSFTCADNPKINRLNPGKCADGTPMVTQHTTRAHGNHSPQHGGSFFMAPDNWHHLEGTYPEAGLFQVYVYDDYSKPLPLDAMKQIAGVVTRGANSFPLRLATDGKRLEARIAGLSMPLELAAKVKFKPGDPEYRFDFVFQEFSKDVDVSAAPLPSQFQSIQIPERTAEIVDLLTQRSKNILALIQRGSFGEIYVDAFQGKDLALALDLRLRELPLAQRSSARSAVERIVRASWQLDSYGDIGDRKLINQAYSVFATAVEELAASFSTRRP